MPASIAVDVGGTFTDLIYRHERRGRVVLAQEPTTPASPREAAERLLRDADFDGHISLSHREQTTATYLDAGYLVSVHDGGALILTRGGRS